MWFFSEPNNLANTDCIESSTFEVDSIPDTSQQDSFLTAPVTPTKKEKPIHCCYSTCFDVAALQAAKSKSSKRAYCTKPAL